MVAVIGRTGGRYSEFVDSSGLTVLEFASVLI